MINTSDKSKCCGCSACAQLCPNQCITMCEDEEGFIYPFTNLQSCIHCNLCNKVCPIINIDSPKQPLQILAAKNNNEIQRLQSSSGGIFILLAEYIIKRSGVVFGAKFNKNWEVIHGYAETLEELEPLMRSKYVQSSIGDSYKKAEHFLKQGREVLFVGTPCQITGLKKFLRKEYDNLLAIDFICHGVPSPIIWKKYLEEISSKQYNNTQKSNNSSNPKSDLIITSINFREKQLGGYSWKDFGFVISAKSPFNSRANKALFSNIFYQTTYAQAFLKDLALRPSCYKCVIKNGANSSDITIADFWGIQKFHPEFDDNKGTSIIFVNTQKGESIIDFISSQLTTIESNMDEATNSNPSYLKSAIMPPKRKIFWKTFFKTQSLDISIKTATHLTIIDRLKRKVLHYNTLFK